MSQHTPVSRVPYGQTEDGQAVDLYTLASPSGVSMSVMSYGATIVDLLVPDRAGRLADVSLGFAALEPYLAKSPYFGSTIGRVGNRIANGRFELDGVAYQLPQNDGAHSLHGGAKGFDKFVWEGEAIEGQAPSVRFRRTSPDGEQGYPGELEVEVTFTLTDQRELRIEYVATARGTTVVNLTNHTYFNLAGESAGLIHDHVLQINAELYTPVSPALIPTGELAPVEGTPLDFRRATSIGARLLDVGGTPVGYDHNFVLSKGHDGEMRLAAIVLEPASGRRMEVLTTEPGIQFYSGNFLDGTLEGKSGKAYAQYSGFCLETQHFPDSPNQPAFPSVVLPAGETYRSTTVYRFGIA